MMKVYIKKNIFLLTAFSFLLGCSSEPNKPINAHSIKVETATIKEEKIPKSVHAVGKVFSKEEIKLAFKTGGIIKNVITEEGEVVKEGQVLAVLHLDEIEANLNQVKLAYKKAKRDFARAEKLYNDSVVTLEQLQNVQTQFEYAKSSLEIAEFNFKYSKIQAPKNGKILKRLAEDYELISPGQPIFVFGAVQEDWVVRAHVSEKDILLLNPSDRAEIYLDAYPRKKINAHLSEVGNSADPYTGTYEIELTIHDENLKLASGLFARFDIYPISFSRNFDVIPISSVIEANENECYVYKVHANNKISKERFCIEVITNGLIYGISDLKNGDMVITEGAAYVNENSEIEIIEPPLKLIKN